MLHGSPAASAMALGGRKEWSRRQLLQRPFEELMTRSASESLSLPRQRFSHSETSSMTLSHHLPQIPGQAGRAPRMSMTQRSNSRLGSNTSLQNLNLADVLQAEGEDGELEVDALQGSKDQSMSGGASPFGQSTGEMDFGLDKRGSFQGAMARNQSPRSQWANTLEAALEEADVQLLFRLDLPLMVKAVADGEIHSLKEVTPPRWNQMKVMAMDFLEELERIGTCRPGQRASLKVVSDLYDCLEEQGCNQGFDALCKSFTFLFGGLEEVQKVLDVNKNGLLSTTEFSMAMCLSGLDLGVICGLDEREIFLAVDVNHSGSISIEELLRFCASKPAETKLSKADRAKKERERKAAAAKSSKSKMNTTAIIEQAGLKVVQEKEVQGVRFQAMVVPKQSSSNLTPSATGAGVGMDVMLEELDEEEIDDMLEVLAQEEILRAQAKWICVSRWLASVLGASSLENEGQERAKTWEDERQQAYDAVEQAVLVPMAAALPAVFTAQDSGAVSGSMEEDASKPTALLAGEELDHQLEKLFQEEATEDGGRKILDRSATRHFFEDLMLADFKWHQKLRMVILDRLYDDTLNIQKEESGLAKGLTFRSLKVVLHRMLRDHAEHWMESFRTNIERQMNKRNKAAPGKPSRPGRP